MKTGPKYDSRGKSRKGLGQRRDGWREAFRGDIRALGADEDDESRKNGEERYGWAWTLQKNDSLRQEYRADMRNNENRT